MARDLSFYDSAELATVSLQLGLSHPPGQPLYTLLAFLFGKLTPHAPLWGLNLLSAVAGGLTLLPALSLAERMVAPEIERAGTWWGLAAALLVGSQHAALWEQATRVEVYALAVLLCLWSAARGAWLLERQASPAAWAGLGLSLGLAAAVNPVLAAFTALASLPALVQGARAGLVRVSHGALLVLGGLAGLALYLYVPLVGAREDALVWGAPHTREALSQYLTGHDFRRNLSVSPGVWLQQSFAWLGFALDIVLLPVWGLGLVGHLLYPVPALTRAFAPLSCALAVAYLARYSIFIPAIPDYVSYVSLATWICLVGVASLLTRLFARAQHVAAAALLAVVATSVVLSPPSVLARSRHRDQTARAIALALLDSAPRDAMVVVGPDHWVAPLWYLQEIEQQRSDVVVVASGLLSSSWYFEHLFRRHPQLAPFPLRGPGGQLGRLSRMLAANPQRPVLFEDPELALALGMAPCVHRFFAAVRTACHEAPAERTQAARLWRGLAERVGEGEPTSLGVLASISYARGMMLAGFGDVPAALQTLLAPVPSAQLDLPPAASATHLNVRAPDWQRKVPLGDPARNFYAAAQLALVAGLSKQALSWMMEARDRGLPEAQEWLSAVAAKAKANH